MNDLKTFFKGDHFAEHVGIELLDISPGKAKARMDIKKEHLNGLDIVHGGAIFTLADLAFAAAANSHGTVAIAININVSYMKATSEGTLYAEATETSLNPKLGTYSVSITSEEGDLIATFQGMAYRKKDKLSK